MRVLTIYLTKGSFWNKILLIKVVVATNKERRPSEARERHGCEMVSTRGIEAGVIQW